MMFRSANSKAYSFFSVLKQSLNGEHVDLTAISIKRAIILLAIPMMLEMAINGPKVCFYTKQTYSRK